MPTLALNIDLEMLHDHNDHDVDTLTLTSPGYSLPMQHTILMFNHLFFLPFFVS